MRKPRGVQIRANRLIGPGKCLVGTIDECPPRGEVVQRPTEAAQEPRGSGPLPSTPARARGSSVRATPSLHPPRILKTISLFYRKEDPEKSRLRGRLQLFFLSLVWGFPIVAAGIPFVVSWNREPVPVSAPGNELEKETAPRDSSVPTQLLGWIGMASRSAFSWSR